MTNKTIGILGGMGPRATAYFQSRLVNAFEGNDQNMPTIITINNGQIPDRTNFLTNNGQDPLQQLIDTSNMLTYAKVDVVCMPCNTAHSPRVLSRLMASVPLPIIDMPAACMLEAERRGFQTVLILGTEGTRQEQIFDNRSTSCKCVYPSTIDQQFVSTIIQDIKKNQIEPASSYQTLINLCNNYKTDAIILACTELSMIPKENFTDLVIIDSIDILIKSCLAIINEVYR